MIEISNLNYSINNNPILKDITTNLPNGKLTALVGTNGAGKSTLLSLIARLQTIQSGQIRVGGLDVSTTPTNKLAKTLAILTQNNVIHNRLTIRDLVAFGRFPHHKGRPTAEDKRKVEEALEQFELTEIATRFLDELSGGQAQKAFVGMTYCQDTDYLLLDEPLNNLDMASSRALMKNLKYLCEEKGKTIVVVLHEINYAAIYADWIVGLKRGHVVASGSGRDIVTTEHLQSIFEIHIDVEKIGNKTIALHY